MEKDMKFTTAGEWMSEKETLEKLSEKISEMQEKGLRDTPEYDRIVDEWETLSQNWVEGRVLYDETSQWEDVQDR